MYKTYAGIGSRKTPLNQLNAMTKLASLLENKGYTLRSGGADGADKAFETGVKDERNKEIFLPWKGFNGNNSSFYNISNKAYQIAKCYHPAWDRLSLGAMKLMARNSYQILGYTLDSPIKFILCYHQNTGGTMQAVRIADAYKIPVINLKDDDYYNKLNSILISLGDRGV
jgi:hypothetical protein